MAKILAIISFAILLCIATYIYLNFETVNFLPSRIEVSRTTSNRFLPEEVIPSGGPTLNTDSWLSMPVVTDTQLLHTNNAGTQGFPPQLWVQVNVLKVLNFLNVQDPSWTTNWARSSYLTLTKTYYSRRTGVIYTGIPKSGCTNWKYTLLKLEGMYEKSSPTPKVHYIINTINLATVLYKYPRGSLDSKYSFTVIRNPWTRMVSGYNDKFNSNRQGMWHKGKVARQILQKYRNSTITLEDVQERGVTPTFIEFLHHLAYDDMADINAHFQPQYNMLSLAQVRYDYISALEHAKEQSEEIFQHFATRLNDNISVPGPYDSSSDPRTERSTLTAKLWFPDVPALLVEQLYTRYKPDFMIYNYSNFTDPIFPFPVYASEHDSTINM